MSTVMSEQVEFYPFDDKMVEALQAAAKPRKRNQPGRRKTDFVDPLEASRLIVPTVHRLIEEEQVPVITLLPLESRAVREPEPPTAPAPVTTSGGWFWPIACAMVACMIYLN